MNDGCNSNNCDLRSYETLFPFEFRYPEFTVLVNAVEFFWGFEPQIRDKAIALHAAELGISPIYFYAIAQHIEKIAEMGSDY